MATCLEIITYALRMCRVVGMGKQPKSAESEEGMIALQSLYDQWRTGGMFGKLTDVYLSDDADAREGYRYKLAAGVTLTEPVTIAPDATTDYGNTDYGNSTERPVRDLALYEKVDSNGVQTARLYDRIEWVDLLDLTTASVAPLSGRDAHGLAACLATSGGFCAAFGVEPPPPVVALARHFLRNVMSKESSQADRTADYY